MAVTYIPLNNTGKENLDAGLAIANWIQQFQDQKKREELLQQELQTGQLRQAALRLDNESKTQQNQFWTDTKDVRLQGMQTEEQMRQAELGKTKVQTELAKKQADYFDLAKVNDQQLHDITMQAHRQELEKGGVDLQTAKIRAGFEGPQLTQQMLNLQQQYQESQVRTQALQQNIKEGASKEAWTSAANAIALSKQLADTPGAYEAMRDNPPDPTMAHMLKAIPPGLDSDKGLTSLQHGLERMASGTGPDAAAATETLSLMAAKEYVPEQLLVQSQVDPRTGVVTHGVNQDTLTKVKSGIEAFMRQKRQADFVGPPKPPGMDQPKPPVTDTTGVNPIRDVADPKSLPAPMAAAWAQSKKHPGLASMPLGQVDLQKPGMNDFLSGYQPDIPGPSDVLVDTNAGRGFNPYRLANKRSESDRSYAKTFGSGYKSLLTMTPQDYGQYDPALKRPEDQSLADSTIAYDSSATMQQHLMYMGLVRHLSDLRNRDQPVAPALDNAYRALGGVDFFTPRQAASLVQFRRSW